MKRFLFKSITLCLFLFLGLQSSYGQAVEENTEVRDYLDDMFEHLDKTKVPNGLLRDYAFELVDLDRFTGSQLTDNNYIDRQTYEMLLRTIRSSAVSTKPFENVANILVKQYSSGNDNTVSISAMAYQYSFIKANAREDGLIRYENNKVYDNYKNSTWQNPYSNQYVTGFCTHDSIFTSTSLTFKLDNNCWFSNLAYKSIELDAGNGYKAITVGGSITAFYSSGGNKDLKLRVTLTSGKQLISHTTIQIDAQALTRGIIEDPDLTKPKTVITGDAYRGFQTRAEVFIKYASSDRRIRKPFIVVEGFDPRSISKANNYGATNMKFFYSNLDHWKFSCMTLLQNYDIIYIDWINSEEYIQANANTLEKVIQWVNEQKHNSGSSASNVIMGQSMGGLVTRYALKNMEKKGLNHETSLYVSDDAPHLGANVPVGALYALYGICSFLENQSTIGSFAEKYMNSGTLLAAAEKMAHCNAAKQMLVNYVDFGGNLNNDEHDKWQQELAALGFPQGDKNANFRMLCIANGSYSANVIPSSYLKADFSASSDLLGIVPILSFLSSPVIGWGLNDIWAGLLNLVPGKSTVKGLFEINPGISMGSKVTEIKLQYVKKFMWVGNIKRTVFSYKSYMQGILTYDNFPSSIIDLQDYKKQSETQESSGVPIVGKIDYSIDIATSIPFIPTSSALCAGFGNQPLSSSVFTSRPSINNTPFGSNTFIYDGLSTAHIELKPIVLEWLTSQLDFGILGPKQGVNGSKYSVYSSNASYVEWSTDNPNIATIDQNGTLQVTGSGIVNITASKGSTINASMEVMIGIPRFVLEDVTRSPGYYSVKAKCIDTKYSDFLSRYNDIIIYKWGIKTNDEALQWFKSNSPELYLSTLENDENTTIYLKTVDQYENESSPLFVRISGYDIYSLGYKTLVFNSKGKLYNDKGSELYYDYITMPLTFREGAYDKYSNAEWNPVGAVVINDENTPRGIPWKRYGYIRDIISSAEKERILSSPDGKVMLYKLVLLNFDGEIIQKTPFTIMYKANFPN